MATWTEDLALRGIPGVRYYTALADLLGDASLTLTVGTKGSVAVGNTLIAEAEGFSYRVAAAGATDHNLTTGSGVKLYAVGANEPFVVMGAGSSQAASNQNSVGGFQDYVDQIRAWNNDASSNTTIVPGTQWLPARFGTPPLNRGVAPYANSVIWQACRKIQQTTNRPVCFYLVALGEVNIEDFITPALLAANGWTATHDFSNLMTALARTALAAVPGRFTTTFDAFVWLQGNNTAAEASHIQAKKLQVLLQQQHDYGLIDMNGTPIVTMELCQFRPWRRRHLMALRYLQTTVPAMRVLRSVGIPDIGDGMHWTGPAMEEVGGRIAGAIFTQPDFFEIENQDVLTATEDGLICLTTREFAHRSDADKRPAVPLASVVGTVDTVISSNIGHCYVKAAGASVEWVSRRLVRMPTEAVARITMELFPLVSDVTLRLRVYAFDRRYTLIDTYDHAIGGEIIPAGVVSRISATFGLFAGNGDVTVPANTGYFAYAISISEGVTEGACEFNWLDARIDQPIATYGNTLTASGYVQWRKEPNGNLLMWTKAAGLTGGPQTVTLPVALAGGVGNAFIEGTPQGTIPCLPVIHDITDTTFQFDVFNLSGARVAENIAFAIKGRWEA